MLHTKHFVAEDNRDLRTSSFVHRTFFRDVFERHGVMGLFDGINGVTFGLQGAHGVQGLFEIGPFDGFFGAEGGLMDLCIRRAATYAAEHDFLDTHRVGGAEDSAYVMLTADVIEHHHQR